jgi:hypothetical protein
MAAEPHRILTEVFGENALYITRSCVWFRISKKGRIPADDDKRSGRPSAGTTENVAKVREAILRDRRQKNHDVCDVVKVSYGTCQRILPQELNMQRIAAKFVPRLPSNDRKEHRVAVCS